MKIATRILALLLLLTLCFTALPACDSGDSTPDTTVAETTAAPTEAPTEPPEPRLTVDSSYRIVVPAEADETTQKTAAALAAALKEKAGLELTVVTDAEEPIAHELVLGHTNRADSTAAEGGYELFQSGEALYIDAEDPITLYYAVQAILDAWLTPDFGLANAGVVTLLESRVADLNGLATKRDTSIKVLSQNLRCADDPNGNSIGERARRFKQLFEEYQPDLLGTQETTAGWNNYLKKFGGSEYGMVGCSRDGREATSGEWNTILYRKDRFELLDSDTTYDVALEYSHRGY